VDVRDFVLHILHPINVLEVVLQAPVITLDNLNLNPSLMHLIALTREEDLPLWAT
jgi:hypothetical protein